MNCFEYVCLPAPAGVLPIPGPIHDIVPSGGIDEQVEPTGWRYGETGEIVQLPDANQS